ncbi:3'-5' DNA helicase, partial [Ascoidea rubescens DSM 1968]
MSDFESDIFDDDIDDLELTERTQFQPLSTVTSNNNNNNHPNNQPQYYQINQPVVRVNSKTHHLLNHDNLPSYIYPTNFEIRDYQFNIIKQALFKNVLVALPTGLGKTFIANTLILNYYRWLKDAKLIFMAPTRPLVAQQIKTCLSLTGIPTDEIAILLDKSRKNRPEIWNSKRVFFTTPQVVENDLKTGFLNPKSIALLIVDEAHRAKGNYAYNNIIKFITRFTLSFRILALTATPASDIPGVQELVDNLLISKIEIRSEKSDDTIKYIKQKEIIKIIVYPEMECQEISEFINYISIAIEPTLKIAIKNKVYENVHPSNINFFKAMQASQKVISNPRYNEGLKWYLYFILQLLAQVGQMLRRLNVYGVRTFHSYLLNKYKEITTKFETGKSKNKTSSSFYNDININKILKKSQSLLTDPKYLGHPKLINLVDQLKFFFNDPKTNSNSRVIIFTELRESALEIVKAIENHNIKNLLKPHIFIGQSKEKEKFDEDSFREKAKPKGRKKKAKANIETEKIEKQKKIEEEKLLKKKQKQERSTTRVGSSEDAQLNGMNQKMQKQLIVDFQKGIYNILVATSIGEEGLDIGEVDLIICYDSTSSPIKNIQRMGRTGRKRDGKIVLLLTEAENKKFENSMETYNFVQKSVLQDNIINLNKSDRIIPKDVTPICEKLFIEIPEENIEINNTEDNDELIKIMTQKTIGKKVKPGKNKTNKPHQSLITEPIKQTKKPKKIFFMPDNVETGFKAASKLVKK